VWQLIGALNLFVKIDLYNFFDYILDMFNVVILIGWG
jgi:hypothetical protein